MLRAVPFDIARLQVTGSPVPVVEGVMTKNSGAVNYAIAADGSLVYVAGAAGVTGQESVVLVDRQGHASPLPGIPANSFHDVKLAPDGKRLTVATQDDIWIHGSCSHRGARGFLSCSCDRPIARAVRNGY